MFREEALWAPTMLCATTMLRSTRDLPIGSVDLNETLKDEFEQLIANRKITRRLSCWTNLASAKAIETSDVPSKDQLWDDLWNNMMKYWIEEDTVWDSFQGENIKETAQVAWALMCFPKRNDYQNKHLKLALQFLIKHAQPLPEGEGIIWHEDASQDMKPPRKESPS